MAVDVDAAWFVQYRRTSLTIFVCKIAVEIREFFCKIILTVTNQYLLSILIEPQLFNKYKKFHFNET